MQKRLQKSDSPPRQSIWTPFASAAVSGTCWGDVILSPEQNPIAATAAAMEAELKWTSGSMSVRRQANAQSTKALTVVVGFANRGWTVENQYRWTVVQVQTTSPVTKRHAQWSHTVQVLANAWHLVWKPASIGKDATILKSLGTSASTCQLQFKISLKQRVSSESLRR